MFHFYTFKKYQKTFVSLMSFSGDIEVEYWPKVGYAQLAITCSKLAIETLEQGVKYVQS